MKAPQSCSQLFRSTRLNHINPTVRHIHHDDLKPELAGQAWNVSEGQGSPRAIQPDRQEVS